ncbi:60S ribosomal protein L14 [Mycetomoellerius zeteki]|nr:PREDICTED: 60S ribosomal protein L14-like [Trachymyrmex zeteki]
MWAKKEAKKKRTELNDFDRFKLRKVRQINKLRTDAFYRFTKRKIKADDAASKSMKKAEKIIF